MHPGSTPNESQYLTTLFSQLSNNPSELTATQLRSMNASLDEAHAQYSKLQLEAEDIWLRSFSRQTSEQLAVDELKQYAKHPIDYHTPETMIYDALMQGPTASQLEPAINAINPRTILNGYKQIVDNLQSIAVKKSQVTSLLQAKTPQASTTGMYANRAVASAPQAEMTVKKHRKCAIM